MLLFIALFALVAAVHARRPAGAWACSAVALVCVLRMGGVL